MVDGGEVVMTMTALHRPTHHTRLENQAQTDMRIMRITRKDGSPGFGRVHLEGVLLGILLDNALLETTSGEMMTMASQDMPEGKPASGTTGIMEGKDRLLPPALHIQVLDLVRRTTGNR